MKISAPPRSDQINADDLIAGPLTVTIMGVGEGKAEQRYDIQVAECDGRAWRPPSTVLRILIAAWGDEADDWIGRRATLYRDDSVKFGPEAVGGIRVSHLSNLPDGKALSGRVTSARGKRVPFTVQPLTESAPTPTTTPTGLATQRQKSALGAHIKRLGLDKDAYLTHATDCAGRIIAATDELTEAEADALVAVLAAIEGESNE